MVAQCDAAIDAAVERAVSGLSADQAYAVLGIVRDHQRRFREDPRYAEVRRRVGAIPGLRRIARLEVAGSMIGDGYAGTWFAESPDGVHELFTAPGANEIRSATVPRSEWDGYLAYVRGLDRSQMRSWMSPAADPAFYFYCSVDAGGANGYVMQAPAERGRVADLVVRTIRASRFMHVPREMEALGK